MPSPIRKADLGAHLTLTSEWETYRWGPISTRDPKTGLMDEQGFFHRRSEGVWEHADPEAAQVELEAQVTRALEAGIKLTHIDTHMGSVAHPKLISSYVQLAMKYGLPLMIPRMDVPAIMAQQHVDEQTRSSVGRDAPITGRDGLASSGRHFRVGTGTRWKTASIRPRKALLALKPGVTHFIIHPSKDTPELRHITTSWDCRVADYETFTSKATRDFIKNEGIQVIGYRALKELMPPLA